MLEIRFRNRTIYLTEEEIKKCTTFKYLSSEYGAYNVPETLSEKYDVEDIKNFVEMSLSEEDAIEVLALSAQEEIEDEIDPSPYYLFYDMDRHAMFIYNEITDKETFVKKFKNDEDFETTKNDKVELDRLIFNSIGEHIKKMYYVGEVIELN